MWLIVLLLFGIAIELAQIREAVDPRASKAEWHNGVWNGLP